jgi:ketosteroid isomerase-like protein
VNATSSNTVEDSFMNVDTEQQISQLGERWAEAELHADTSALDALLDEDFVAVGPFGFILTKSEWLDRHRSGDLNYEVFTWEPGNLRRYGDAVIVIGVQASQATYQGNPVPVSQLRATQIIVNIDGRWVLAGLHMSPMGGPPR